MRRAGSIITCMTSSPAGILSLYELHPFCNVEVVGYIVELSEYMDKVKFVGTVLVELSSFCAFALFLLFSFPSSSYS